jgi:hypothetical protein
MKKTEISVTCGIYDTVITILDYGHKICITEPYVKWVNNSGSLDFGKETFTDEKKMKLIRRFADAEELYVHDGDDVITWDEI